VSIVVTTTLKDLEAATGKGLTGGGTLVPMSDVIRWASQRPQLFGDFRPRQAAGAVPHEAFGFPRTANHVVRQRSRVHEAGL
jgi:hypothetical protein